MNFTISWSISVQREANNNHPSSHCKLVFIFLSVHDMRVLTDSTDSIDSLAVGEVLVRI